MTTTSAAPVLIVNPRRVFFLDESMLTAEGYVPSIVEEGQPGHCPCNFDWGMDYAKARAIADDSNQQLGYTTDQVQEIIIGSMNVSAEVNGRQACDYVPMRAYPGHSHGRDMIVGYVVRETIRDDKILWHGEHTGPGDAHEYCGFDVLTVVGSSYADTFVIRDRYRARPGGYAVVDTLYSCGCRSGR